MSKYDCCISVGFPNFPSCSATRMQLSSAFVGGSYFSRWGGKLLYAYIKLWQSTFLPKTYWQSTFLPKTYWQTHSCRKPTGKLSSCRKRTGKLPSCRNFLATFLCAENLLAIFLYAGNVPANFLCAGIYRQTFYMPEYTGKFFLMPIHCNFLYVEIFWQLALCRYFLGKFSDKSTPKAEMSHGCSMGELLLLRAILS